MYNGDSTWETQNIFMKVYFIYLHLKWERCVHKPYIFSVIITIKNHYIIHFEWVGEQYVVWVHCHVFDLFSTHIFIISNTLLLFVVGPHNNYNKLMSN